MFQRLWRWCRWRLVAAPMSVVGSFCARRLGSKRKAIIFHGYLASWASILDLHMDHVEMQAALSNSKRACYVSGGRRIQTGLDHPVVYFRPSPGRRYRPLSPPFASSPSRCLPPSLQIVHKSKRRRNMRNTQEISL
jgi:hypothetical protein